MLTSVPNSHILPGGYVRGEKLKARLMGKATDFFFTVSPVASYPLLSPKQPSFPPASIAMSTKLGLGMWPPAENHHDGILALKALHRAI